jgi:LmbE family N-acetylglucosaminyl deacetylase
VSTPNLQFSRPTAEIFVPDGKPVDEALAQVTHMAIVAHPDDIEVMAMEGVLACFDDPAKGFLGVVVTDGAGSARAGIYADYSDEQMKTVRRVEQMKAAFLGEYSAQAFLDHPSSAVKDPMNPAPVEDLKQLAMAARPEVVYIHNLADKHPTHVAVALRSIAALRAMPKEKRPKRVIGCEVWRDLDWMVDSDKVVLRLDGHENLAAALIGVFDSQIAGGKRYDLATLGRRRANATYHESHAVDTSQMVNFGMDLTPLVHDETLDITVYVLGHIDRLREEVASNLHKFSNRPERE